MMKTLASCSDRNEIYARILASTPSDRRAWAKMTVGQMVCHLTDSYKLLLGEKSARPATGFLQRTIIKWIALRWPLKGLKNVPTRPEMEQGGGGTPPQAFESDREHLLRTLERFCETGGNSQAPHPIFGKLTPEEWMRWGYLHADHHLRQFGR